MGLVSLLASFAVPVAMANRAGFAKIQVQMAVSLMLTAFSFSAIAASVSQQSSKTVAVIDTVERVRAMDFSRDKVIFIGESDHYDTSLLQVELEILGAISKSNPAKKKCLLLEAEPAFDQAFQVLSKSTSQASINEANAILDEQGQMGSTIDWFGATYPLDFFKFAIENGWIVRSGDKIRDPEYRRILRDENPTDEWINYYEIYERNQFMASRIEELSKSECDLVVGLYGSQHLTQISVLPTFKVRNLPVPALLEKKSIRSTTVIAANPRLLRNFDGLLDRSKPTPKYRKPEAVVAY